MQIFGEEEEDSSGTAAVNINGIMSSIRDMVSSVATLQLQAIQGVDRGTQRAERETAQARQNPVRAESAAPILDAVAGGPRPNVHLPPSPVIQRAPQGTLASIAASTPDNSLEVFPETDALLDPRQGTSPCLRLERLVTLPLTE